MSLRFCFSGLCVMVIAGLSTAAEKSGGAASGSPVFTDITESAGIRFMHSYGDRNMSNIVEATGPGCTFFDYDNDGHVDIYLLNGAWMPEVSDNLGRDLRGKLANALYRNNGDGTFTDVTERARVGDRGYGMSASAADYDRDGDLDLYVLNYGPNVSYRNNGDGTFTDVTAKAGLGDPGWSVSAPWLDYDNDGDLDVYVANYLQYDAGAFRTFYAASGFPGPLSYKGQADHLYRNNGDGTFTDVTEIAGLSVPEGRAMSAVACDLNHDGFTDVYVANDAMPNYFHVNDGKGRFAEQAVVYNAAFGEGGQGASSMGPTVGDVDGDGRMDLYVPDMGYGCLLINKGKMFVDMTASANLAVIAGQYVGWGAVLFDVDNDTDSDLFLSTGDPHHEYAEHPVLARNEGQGRFVDISSASGAYFQKKYVVRGAASADIDNDGDLDLLVANVNSPPALLRNDRKSENHWLVVAPKSAGTNMDAIGARVTVTVGSRRLVRDVLGVTGYLAQCDTRAHFGLGAAKRADQIEIRWPDRTVTLLKNVKANQFLTVVQESGSK